MARRPPLRLFHGTGILQLAEILASDVLVASPTDDHDDSGLHGLSMSSAKGVAQRFADEAKERDWERRWQSPVMDGAILELDGWRLDEVVGVSSVTWDGTKAEREWRTRSDVRGVYGLLRHIELDPASCVWWIDVLREEEMEAEATALEAIPIELIHVCGRPLPAIDGVATLGDHVSRLRPVEDDPRPSASLGTTPSPT